MTQFFRNVRIRLRDAHQAQEMDSQVLWLVEIADVHSFFRIVNVMV